MFPCEHLFPEPQILYLPELYFHAFNNLLVLVWDQAGTQLAAALVTSIVPRLENYVCFKKVFLESFNRA